MLAPRLRAGGITPSTGTPVLSSRSSAERTVLSRYSTNSAMPTAPTSPSASPRRIVRAVRGPVRRSGTCRRLERVDLHPLELLGEALLLGAGHQRLVELPVGVDGALEFLVADQLFVGGDRVAAPAAQSPAQVVLARGRQLQLVLDRKHDAPDLGGLPLLEILDLLAGERPWPGAWRRISSRVRPGSAPP